jgi:hypothetical protein
VGNLRDAKAGLKVGNITAEGGSHLVFRVPKTQIVFEPSVFNGTGEEPRKGIVLYNPQEEAKDISAFEEIVRGQMNIQPEKWQSCVRKHNGEQALKAKFDLTGRKACKFTDTDGTKAEAPEAFKGREADVAVLVRAVFAQKNSGGLVMDVVAMKYGAAKAPEQPDWWAPAGQS